MFRLSTWDVLAISIILEIVIKLEVLIAQDRSANLIDFPIDIDLELLGVDHVAVRHVELLSQFLYLCKLILKILKSRLQFIRL